MILKTALTLTFKILSAHTAIKTAISNLIRILFHTSSNCLQEIYDNKSAQDLRAGSTSFFSHDKVLSIASGLLHTGAYFSSRIAADMSKK